MNVSDMLEAIGARATERFELEEEGRESARARLHRLCPDDVCDHGVVRLRRTGAARGGWRTMLVASLPNADQLGKALRWTADVREELPDPEASDLYLLIVGPGLDELDPETIESDEHFCRKLVQRTSEETPNAMLDRTFLAPTQRCRRATWTVCWSPLEGHLGPWCSRKR